MNGLLPLFSHISIPAAGALVSAAWQGAILAILVTSCMRVFPRLSAAARSIIWLNVFILLASLHFVPFLAGRPAGSQLASHAVQLDFRWSIATACCWLAVSTYRAVQLIVSGLHLRALSERARAVETGADLDALLHAPGHRHVRLCTSEEVGRPSVLGFFRPLILLPQELLEALSPQELRQVVIHEMEHLHRGDDWTNLLQKLALVLFPLNPALVWVERRLCAERELACDDRVLAAGSGRRAYALCLTHLAEFSLVRRGFSLALGAWEHRPELVRRVERILAQPAHTMRRKPALAACGSLMAGVLGCTLSLAHAPQLISFVPSAHQGQQAQIPAEPDAVTVARSLGGTPSLIKTMAANEPRGHAMLARLAAKSHHLPHLRPARLASLRTPPPPADFSADAAMVMAQFAEMQNIARLNYVASRYREFHRPYAIQAVYVVRTPNGWLIIQI